MFVLGGVTGAFVLGAVSVFVGGLVWSPPPQPVSTPHVTRPNSTIRAIILFIGRRSLAKIYKKDKKNLSFLFPRFSRAAPARPRPSPRVFSAALQRNFSSFTARTA